MGINFKSTDAIILSHGHLDHIAARSNILKISTHKRLICHPDAFLKRWIVFPDGWDKAKMQFLDKENFERNGAIVITKLGPRVVSK